MAVTAPISGTLSDRIGTRIPATIGMAILAIGLDTPSIDHGPSQTFASHVALFEHDIPAFENLANLERLPATGFEIVALPMKIGGGSGAPLRIVAILDGPAAP